MSSVQNIRSSDLLSSSFAVEEHKTPSVDFIVQKALQLVQKRSSLENPAAWLGTTQVLDLTEILEHLSKEVAFSEDPIQVLEQVAQAIPLENIQDAVRKKYDGYVNVLQTAKEMLPQAKYFLEKMETGYNPSLKAAQICDLERATIAERL